MSELDKYKSALKTAESLTGTVANAIPPMDQALSSLAAALENAYGRSSMTGARQIGRCMLAKKNTDAEMAIVLQQKKSIETSIEIIETI